jgi:hypothetical protein
VKGFDRFASRAARGGIKPKVGASKWPNACTPRGEAPSKLAVFRGIAVQGTNSCTCAERSIEPNPEGASNANIVKIACHTRLSVDTDAGSNGAANTHPNGMVTAEFINFLCALICAIFL